MDLSARAWTAAPAAASAAILAGQALRLPSPLKDALTGAPARGVHLELPLGYVLAAPFSGLADLVTFNSARQDEALVAWLLLGYWAARAALAASGRGRWTSWPRELWRYAAYSGAVLLFLAWAILSPRPTARLVAEDPDTLLVDFHSHTRYSHDGRRSFTPLENMRWHARMGFSAGFITDHNTQDGAREALELARRGEAPAGYRPLLGEEVSLQGAHVGVLGNRAPIDNRPYDGSEEGLRRFLGECERVYGGLPVLNLPEYWLNYFDRVEAVAAWGARGIEIVNAVPKALDMPRAARKRALKLALDQKLFLAGVTDNHGWGSASYAWSLVRLPGQAGLGPAELQEALLAKLKADGAGAVSVVTRVKRSPSRGLGLAFDPILGAWVMIRTWSWAQAASCLAWVWLAAGLGRRRRDGEFATLPAR